MPISRSKPPADVMDLDEIPFQRIEVQYWREASDQKLGALARAGLTNLTCVTMNWGGELVTDRGIEALTSLPSLNSLGLEGSRITDAGT